MTLDVLFVAPEPLPTVSVTVYDALLAGYACDVVTPVPVAPSPKVQLYVVAFVELPPSNEQVRFVHE